MLLTLIHPGLAFAGQGANSSFEKARGGAGVAALAFELVKIAGFREISAYTEESVIPVIIKQEIRK